MTKQIGKVIEVFIPDEDIMNSTKIGFKVLIDNEVIEIIQEQNEMNSYILREDEVLITIHNLHHHIIQYLYTLYYLLFLL